MHHIYNYKCLMLNCNGDLVTCRKWFFEQWRHAVLFCHAILLLYKLWIMEKVLLCQRFLKAIISLNSVLPRFVLVLASSCISFISYIK